MRKMNAKNGIYLLLLCCFLTFVSSAAAQKVLDATPGSMAALMGGMNGRTYVNRVLNFELKLPDEGVILNQAEMDVYKNAGIDALKSGNAQSDRQLADAAKREIVILNYATKPVGSIGNSILAIGTIKQARGATAAMVIAATLKGLTATGKFELIRSLSGVVIGGFKANGLEGNITTFTGAKIKERILVLMRNGYSLSFVLSGTDDDAINVAQNLLGGIKFLAK